MVSIIINNYNYARFLPQAIDSALNQTYPLVEIIIVDDGSTDRSKEVILDYAQKDNVILCLKENGGQASAFNEGFRFSSGDIIIFLDADDKLLPDSAANVVNSWSPNLSKVHWLLQAIDENDHFLPLLIPSSTKLRSGDFKKQLLKWGEYYSSPTTGNAFNRSFLKSILPMPEKDWKIAADAYLVFLAPFYGFIKALDAINGYYRIHGNNAWYTPNSYLWSDEQFHMFFNIELKKRALLLDHARQMGFTSALRMTPSIAKMHIRQVLFFSCNGPLISYMQVFNYAVKGFYSCILYPGMPLIRRILKMGMFGTIAFLPNGLSRWLFKQTLKLR